MKRLVAALAAFCVVLSGCATVRGTAMREGSITLSPNFSCAVDLQMGTLSLSGDVTRSAAGDLSLTVRSPDSMRGMAFSQRDGEFSASYMGFEFSVDKEVQPQSAVLKLLGETLSVIDGAEFQFPRGEESCMLKLQSKSGELEVVVDTKNFLPKSVWLANLDFGASFYIANI